MNAKVYGSRLLHDLFVRRNENRPMYIKSLFYLFIYFCYFLFWFCKDIMK